jgi:hypothetical protein
MAAHYIWAKGAPPFGGHARGLTSSPSAPRVTAPICTSVPMKIDGHFAFERPVADLATVFDMCGLTSHAGPGDQLTATGEAAVVRVARVSDSTCTIAGDVSSTPEAADALAAQIALAFEADGIAFTLRLYDSNGAERRRFSPLG